MPMVMGGTISPEYEARSPMRGEISSSVASERQGQLSHGKQSLVPAQQSPQIETGMSSMATSCNMGHGKQHIPQLQQGYRPRHGPEAAWPLDASMV